MQRRCGAPRVVSISTSCPWCGYLDAMHKMHMGQSSAPTTTLDALLQLLWHMDKTACSADYRPAVYKLHPAPTNVAGQIPVTNPILYSNPHQSLRRNPDWYMGVVREAFCVLGTFYFWHGGSYSGIHFMVIDFHLRFDQLSVGVLYMS